MLSGRPLGTASGVDACLREASLSAGGQRHGAESWQRILAGEAGWLLPSADQVLTSRGGVGGMMAGG